MWRDRPVMLAQVGRQVTAVSAAGVTSRAERPASQPGQPPGRGDLEVRAEVQFAQLALEAAVRGFGGRGEVQSAIPVWRDAA